jgi:hypothetical protein
MALATLARGPDATPPSEMVGREPRVASVEPRLRTRKGSRRSSGFRLPPSQNVSAFFTRWGFYLTCKKTLVRHYLYFFTRDERKKTIRFYCGDRIKGLKSIKMTQAETKNSKLTGQWFGHSDLDNPKESSLVVLNIEPRSPLNGLLIGVTNQLRKIADATIEYNGSKVAGRTFNYRVYDSNVHNLVPLPIFLQNKNVTDPPPTEALYEGEFDGEKLKGTFKNDRNQTGRFELQRTFSEVMHGKPHSRPDDIKPINWSQFKRHVAAFRSKGKVLFRGQHSRLYPLRTSFHRKERNNVPLYLAQDVFRLRHQICEINQPPSANKGWAGSRNRLPVFPVSSQ